MALPKVDQGFCERLVTTAMNHCAAATPVPPSAALPPNFDALAAAFGGLSAAFTWGTIILAIVAVLAAAGWGFLVKVWAEKEARQEAERCAQKHVEAHMQKWLATEAPQIVRRHVENLVNASLGDEDDEEAAEEIGKEAG